MRLTVAKEARLRSGFFVWQLYVGAGYVGAGFMWEPAMPGMALRQPGYRR